MKRSELRGLFLASLVRVHRPRGAATAFFASPAPTTGWCVTRAARQWRAVPRTSTGRLDSIADPSFGLAVQLAVRFPLTGRAATQSDLHNSRRPPDHSCYLETRFFQFNDLSIVIPRHTAGYFWPAGSEEAETWVAERALQILKGNASHVAAGMRRSATFRGLSDGERKAVDDCADYLPTYTNMVRYDEYLAQGLPIATGVIEGACRHLVNDRMDITGARWGLQRAGAVLKLRSLQSTGDADAYWDFFKAQALQRNHASRYEGFPLDEAA